MFGWMKKHVSPEAATDRQKRYARRLNLDVSKLSKADATAAISKAEAANPDTRASRVHALAAKRLKEFGPELIAEEARWEEIIGGTGYILAAYARGNSTIVDVLQVNHAEIGTRRKVVLTLASPKVTKDRHAGDFLEWEREFDIPVDAIVFHEVLREEPDIFDLAGYKRLVERGLKRAKA